MAEPLSDSQRQEIQTHLFAGRKIQAIKAYREAMGTDLKDAKDAVDAMDIELRAASPEKFTAPSKGGCLPVVVVFVLVPAAAAWILL